MGEKLTYICMLLCICGLCTIAFVDAKLKLQITALKDISNHLLERKVRVRADISRVHKFEGGSTSLTLQQEGFHTQVFIPSYLGFNQSFENKKIAEVVGVLRLYKGRLEIVVESGDQVVLW